MRIYHNTRDEKCRSPYGAVATGAPVSLALEIWDAADVVVELRTWVDGIGEARFAMKRTEAGDGGPTRYETTLKPDDAGIVWYQFVITTEDDRELRYGAREGRTGGKGRLLEWEPPSFKLAVYDENDLDASRRDARADHAFENALVAFLRRDITAFDLVNTIDDLHEAYPAEAFPAALGLLSDSRYARLFARLGGANASFSPGGKPDLDISGYGLGDWQKGLAKGRLWFASLIVMALSGTLPGQGGVCATEGEAVSWASTLQHAIDLWGRVDADCADIVTNVADLYKALPVLAEGIPAYFALDDDVFGVMRRGSVLEGQAACVLVNASMHQEHDATVPLAGEAVSDVLDGYKVPVLEAADAVCAPGCDFGDGAVEPERFARIHLGQSRSAVLYFHPRTRLERDMESGVGVLAHVTSLPARGKTGTLGAPARKFVDWLAKAGVRYWQVLPVNPTDSFGSPYAGISAFAGNVRLLEGGFDPAAFAAAEAEIAIGEEAYEEFCTREADWLEPYACFMAIRQKVGDDVAWQDWPEEYRTFDSAAVAQDAELGAVAETWRRAQFAFDRQWRDLRAYANERGVQIVGDMPIYVSSDSADVWSHPEIFQLGADGRPAVVAGCPPDRFAEEGQVWGNPVYDWDKLADDGYSWWLRRLERAFDLYDWVRLDHFIGFARYFSIPAGHKAYDGAYRPGPGEELFRAAYDAFGPLPIIAEDLGTITPAIRALDAVCGFPGMDIVQFVDGNDPLAGYRPRPEKVVYTGTHDNQTLVGYCAERYPNLDAVETASHIMDKVLTCNAPVAVIPLQDALGLGDEARMNVPGTASGNWTWRAKSAEIKSATGALRAIVETHREAH